MLSLGNPTCYPPSRVPGSFRCVLSRFSGKFCPEAVRKAFDHREFRKPSMALWTSPGQGQVALSSAPTVYSCREEVGGRLMLREKLKPPVAAGLVPLWMETSATLLVVTATGFQLLFQEGIPGWLEYKALWTVYWSPCSYLSNTDNRDPPSTWELGALFSCLSLKWPQVSLQSAAQSCVGSSL